MHVRGSKSESLFLNQRRATEVCKYCGSKVTDFRYFLKGMHLPQLEFDSLTYHQDALASGKRYKADFDS